MTGAAVYLLLGLSLLLATVLPHATRRIAISPPMVLVAVGMLIGLLPLAGEVSLEPQDHQPPDVRAEEDVQPQDVRAQDGGPPQDR